jgi:hypothetical protein
MNPREIIEAVIVEDDEAKKPLGLQIGRAVTGVIAGIAATVAAKGLWDKLIDYKDSRSNEDEDNLTDLQYNE